MADATQECRLAVIVPAFKPDFLAKALASVLRQNDQRFALYVCDDASPADIQGIARSVLGGRPYSYKRFADNLGGVSLPRHWNRCVAESSEPWVWLFADDDEMEPDCVAAFWREVERTRGGFDLYRFNSCCIDKASKVLSVNQPYPREESGREFLLARLRTTRASTAQELIFSRRAWTDLGGFPDFPLAWATDDAFIAELGRHKPIRLIDGPRILWRHSGSNITSVTSTSVLSRKILASQKFVAWAGRFLVETRPDERPFTQNEVDRMTQAWFFRWLCFTRNRLSWQNCAEVDRFLAVTWRHPRGYGWLWCLQWNARMLGLAAWRRLCGLRSRSRPAS